MLFIVLFLINWLYPVVFELTPGAATPGKRVSGFVCADGGWTADHTGRYFDLETCCASSICCR